MKRLLVIALVVAASFDAAASWYWPFGSDDDKKPPRVSELTEKASEMLDTAGDLADDGKLSEAIAEYDRAITELDRIAAEHPDLMEMKEYASVRNKRAIAVSSRDSLKLAQANRNAKAVTVTDTTELQKKYEAKHAKAKADAEAKARAAVERTATNQTVKAEVKKAPLTRADRLRQAADSLSKGDFDAATATLRQLLSEKPNDAATMVLMAAVEAASDHPQAAKLLLESTIEANPRYYRAFYNLAVLTLQVNPANKEAARRYYDSGRAVGGPQDRELEEALK